MSARFAVTVIVEGDYATVVDACRDVDHALITHHPLQRGTVHDLVPTGLLGPGVSDSDE